MISLNWVKEYIKIDDLTPEELAVKITEAGVNIEKIVKTRIDNLVIGKVVECVMHPDSDHLHICQVDVGGKITQIVCGAPNVRKGLKVLVALPGCKLGDIEIKAGKIRGRESNGMICALYELGLEKKTEETYAKGIAEIETSLDAGTDANVYLGTDDTLLELDVHKHRNNDCYYHIGFAYEIASILNRKVKLPNFAYKSVAENVKDYVKLEVKTEKCPFYLAKMVTNVKVAPSPDFIKKRLIAAGMRSINNVVDISNYVMLEFGQPLHFFDKDKVGNRVLVRDAISGEELITLDGIQRKLNANDIVITDGKKPICLAGVMGGENTEVDCNTKNILIESAIFDGVSIRNTASRHDLKSEASIRYGKGLNFEYTQNAIDRACYLLQKYAGATVLDGTIVHDKLKKKEKRVTFKTEKVSLLLGLDLTEQDVATELKRLDFPFRVLPNGEFEVIIPNRRLDIDENVNDIAEEIGRLYGYHNLKSTLPTLSTRQGEYVGDVKIRKEISKRLRTLGLNECKTYTLISEESAKLFDYQQKQKAVLPNPMVFDKSVVRTSLLSSLLGVYDYNNARGVKDIMLYEIAKTYDKNYVEESKVAILMKGSYIKNEWQSIDVKVDFFVIKGMVENLLNYLGFKNRYAFVREQLPDLHPGISAKILLDREEIGVIGRVHPKLKQDEIYVAELSMSKLYEKQIKPIKFKEANKYPEMVKDVAFVVDELTDSEKIRQQIKKSGGKLLDTVEEFDVYNEVLPGKKSIAYRLTFKDATKTLLEDDVMNVFNKIIEEVEAKTGAKLR